MMRSTSGPASRSAVDTLRPSIRLAVGIAAGLLLAVTPLYAQSGKIYGFPLPLSWGMTKAEIEHVVATRGLHLVVRDGKQLSAPRYSEGRNYSWAAIREESVEFLKKRRFVVFKMNEQDRLVGLSLKLIDRNPVAHPVETMSLIGQFSEGLGAPFKKNSVEMGIYESQRTAWQIPKNSVLEVELEKLSVGGKDKITSYVNLYWDPR